MSTRSRAPIASKLRWLIPVRIEPFAHRSHFGNKNTLLAAWKGPAFAGGVSLDETRELDALATSRLALAAFLRQALMQSPLGK